MSPQRPVDLAEPPVRREERHADRVVLEGAAEPLLALGQGAVEPAVLDGHRGQVREALDEAALARGRFVRVAVVDRERAQHGVPRPVRPPDGARPARAQAVRQGQLAVPDPAVVDGDVGRDDLGVEVGAGAAGAGERADPQAVDGGRVRGRQAGCGAVTQGGARGVEQQHRAAAAGHELLERLGDGGEHLRQPRARGEELQDGGLPVQQRHAVGRVEVRRDRARRHDGSSW
jgi:hypothetical protein